MSIFFLFLSPPKTFFFFFFNDTATTEIYTLSLHDALPFSPPPELRVGLSNSHWLAGDGGERSEEHTSNSSHVRISYAVFCLKKKKASMPPLTHLRDLVYK